MGNMHEGDRWPGYVDLDTGLNTSIAIRDPDFSGLGGSFNDRLGTILATEQWWNSDTYHMANQGDYIAVNYFGLVKEKHGSYIVKRLWVKHIKGKPEFNGTETNCVFYQARKVKTGGIFGTGWLSQNLLQFHQYGRGTDQQGNGYNAKTLAQRTSWHETPAPETEEIIAARTDAHGSTGFGRGGGSGPERRGGRSGRDSGLPTFVPKVTSAQTEEARAIFIQASSGGNHWQGKFTEEREAMERIAQGITSSIPTFQQQITGGDKMLKDSINKALGEAGYTPSQIVWFHNGGITNPLKEGLVNFKLGSKTGDSFSPEAKRVSPPAPKVTPPTPAVTKIKVRAPLGYTQPAGRGADMRPHIAQVGAGGVEDRYYFHNIPNAVSYQGLGSRWVEVPRKGDFPIVEWSDWTLMKVSFDFLVAHEHDGFYADVAEELEQLRRMAQRPLPVSVFGMDQLFEIQMQRASRTQRAMQFVIANFNIKSARRVAGEGNKEIAAAQCSMTLQEIPIEEMKVVEMSLPPLTGPDIPGAPGDGPEASSPYMLDAHPDVKQVGADNLMAGPVVTRED